MAAGAWSLLLLAACAGPPRAAVEAPQLQRFEARAYPAQHQLETAQSEELRLARGLPMRLVWLRPREAGPRPLVLYMPGAGQDATAHAHWRQALARAGYVVLSWQPLPEDDRLPGAGADLRAWAAQRFGAASLARRGALLDALMAELARAQAAGEPALQGVDLHRVALAGYELGAWTALFAAGEQVRGAAAPAARFQAVLAISPHASFDQGGFDTRWREVRGPLLSITSDNDADPFGLGLAPYLRAAPYGGMPPGQKWLLMLRGTTHDALGGRVGAERVPGVQDDPRPARGERNAGDGSGGGGGGGGGNRPQGGRRGEARNGGMARDVGAAPRASEAVSPAQLAMQESAMVSVALAFLDAALDDDALARRWLAESAPRWLAPVADLQNK
jgi:predicted dienelactone hydrolase